MTEKELEYHRRWRAKNKEKVSAANLKWHERHREYLSEKASQWQKDNKDKANFNNRISYHRTKKFKIFERKYGLTKEQYEKLCEIPNCQVCGKPFSGMQSHNRRYIDHCHNTGIVRGVLCRDCNLCEGLMKTPQNVLKLYKYMTRNALFYPTI